MHKFLLTLGAAALIGASAAAANADLATKPASCAPAYEKLMKRQQPSGQRQWAKGAANRLDQQRVVREEPDGALPPTSSWGTLVTPDNENWMYTLDYTYGQNEDYETIESVGITIYDADLKVFNKLTMDLQLAENESSINYIELVPTITRKFFNYDDYYEIMVYVHATTYDYVGNTYTKVFSLKDGSYICDMPGNNIGMINTAVDRWSENYTMAFMREVIDEEWNYYYLFDIYGKATWGSNGPALLHTFAVDNATFAGAGDMALPFLMSMREDHKIFYALPRYELPFFDEGSYWDENPLANENNHFIIDLYDDAFNLIKTTSIPMEIKEGYLYSFPGMGELRGFNDLSFGVFSHGDDPVYVIGMENYVPTQDDFLTDLHVYDVNGNLLATIVEDAFDYISMSDVPGQEAQICALKTDGETATFNMIDIPSCHQVVSINPNTADDNNLTTMLDRVGVGDSYQYVSSMAFGEVNDNDETLHKIAWLNIDGTLNHIDAINLGFDIALAQPYINQEAFNPFLFNTDTNIEYMILVKQYDDIMVSSKSSEKLRIYSDNSNKLLEIGPDAENGDKLNAIFLLNPTSPKGKLVTVYYGETDYTIKHFNLPLMKFAGGDGTIDNPYLISTPGDLTKLYIEPSANYAFVNDIDFDNQAFPINQGAFSGTLDGRGFKVTNANFNEGGMFEYLNGKAQVKNLTIESSSLTGAYGGGFIAIEAMGESTASAPVISNIHLHGCSATGSNDTFGGIVGTLSLFSRVEGCSVDASNFVCDGEAEIGGIVGRLKTSSVVNACFFHGYIEGPTAAGIAASSSRGDETITNCHVNASVVGTRIAGGIMGESSRSTINNCYVQGEVLAVGNNTAYAGGLVGWLDKAFEKQPPVIIANNIVNCTSIEGNSQAAKKAVHRIIGCSSIDQPEIDWDKVTPEMNPSEYPLLPGDTELALDNNYAIGLEGIDPAIADDAASTEGKTITEADVTAAFLEECGWKLGDSLDAPWKLDVHTLYLFFEDRGPYVGIESTIADKTEKNIILYNGSEISAAGETIEIYTLNGMLVARSAKTIYTGDLAKGAYMAKAGKHSLKFIVK